MYYNCIKKLVVRFSESPYICTGLQISKTNEFTLHYPLLQCKPITTASEFTQIKYKIERIDLASERKVFVQFDNKIFFFKFREVL